MPCSRFGARVIVTEIDPINALQAAMEGYEVTTMEEAVAEGDIFVTTTGCRDIITGKHMSQMKNDAIVCNIGHFDLEIDMAWLEGEVKARQREEGQHQAAVGGRQVHVRRRPLDRRAGRRPPGEPRLCDRPSVVRDEQLVHEPGAGSARAVDRDRQVRIGVHVLPKKLDEEVARLHLAKLGVKLTKLTQKQSDYIGVPDRRAVQAGILPVLMSSALATANRLRDYARPGASKWQRRHNPRRRRKESGIRGWPYACHRVSGLR